MRKSLGGFTIVELLIVIVVIAILATISIVAYNGIQNRTNDSAIQSDLKSLATKFELFKVDSPASVYPNANATELNTLGFKATKTAYQTSGTTQNLSYCFAAGYSSYVVVAKSKSGIVYFISSSNTAPRVSAGSWDNNPNTACTNAEPSVTISGNSRGYASEDVTTGPWRAWVGGN